MATRSGFRRGARLLCGVALPVLGLNLLALAPRSALAAAVLPSGGVVQAGSATIGAPSSSGLTISQSSARAIINWSSFSVGQGGTVQFNNGAGATLNRVSGGGASAIDGLLSATGSVYLINPNGVIIGKTGVVKTGGEFVASTLDIGDGAFLSGGDLVFSGSSNAAVINLGKIGSLGGDVALIAAKVENVGAIDAESGSAALVAGYQVTLRDTSLDDGRFAVAVGGPATSAGNTGVIRAAEVELRANGGNVYALAGNTTGVIEANAVAAGGGKVFLVADGGTLQLGGAITARGLEGAGGQIETSGAVVQVGAAKIDAGQGGSWLLDPNNLTIDQPAANTIAATLNAGTNVTEQTKASGTGGSGDIAVAANVAIDWSTSAGLTLSAYRNISLGSGSAIASTGGGAVTLYADNTGTGVGTVKFAANAKVSTTGAVNIFYDPSVNPAGSGVNTASYVKPTETYAANVGGGATLTAYMLVNTLADLQNVRNNLTGSYAQGRNIDASATAGWNGGTGFTPIGTNSLTPFRGVFNGQGHTISGLWINDPSVSYVGLFGAASAATLENIGLAAQVTGQSDVGALVGAEFSTTITDSDATGAVSGGGSAIGGLVGATSGGAIIASSATDNVSGGPSAFDIGGLVGLQNSGAIAQSNAAGAVSGGSYSIGGLVGDAESGAVTQSYATGPVSAGDGANLIGGLVGVQGAGSTISQSDATGAVTGGATVGGVGGLVGGAFGGAITQSYATGAVSGGDHSSRIGGLVGAAFGDAITQTYALGAVSGGAGSNSLGSLVGGAFGGTINQTYATGAVSGGPGSTALGPLVGYNTSATVTASYWDSQTSGLSSSTVGTPLNTAGFFTAANLQGFTFGTTPGASGWVIVDADGSLNNAAGVPGATRPMLLSEYSTSIVNAHQLQLMALNLGASYTLAANVDASATSGANPAGLWTRAGFVPIGFSTIGFPNSTVARFTGNFDGQDHVINGLTINRPGDLAVGLFGVADGGAIANVGLVGGSFSNVEGYVGPLVGVADDVRISDSYATGAVNGFNAGGLVGEIGGGSITQSYATGAVSAIQGYANIGGLAAVADDATITASYATGAVTSSSGGGSAGGLIGDAIGGVLTQTYATGLVSGVNGPTSLGGLVGANNGAVATASYWDTTTSGQSTSAAGVGLTKTQFFSGLPSGFDPTIWGEPPGGGYPYLLWRGH